MQSAISVSSNRWRRKHEKGTRRKELIFPAGEWEDEDGNRYAGGRHTVETPLEKLAWFRRKE